MGFHVPYVTNQEIERQVQELIVNFAESRGHAWAGPTPIDDIAEKHLGLGIEFDDLGRRLGKGDDLEILGAIDLDQKRIIIDESLDPDLYPTLEARYRFTLAHEVGHWQLHRGLVIANASQASALDRNGMVKIDCRSSQTRDRMEIQANRFASCLLMPRQEVYGQWKVGLGLNRPVVFDDLREYSIAKPPVYQGLRPLSHVVGGVLEDMGLGTSAKSKSPQDVLFDRTARQLAPHFHVSTQAMRYRLEDLGLLIGNNAERRVPA